MPILYQNSFVDQIIIFVSVIQIIRFRSSSFLFEICYI